MSGSRETLRWSKGDSNSRSQPHTVRSKAPAPSVVRLKRRPFDPGPGVRIHLPPPASLMRTDCCPVARSDAGIAEALNARGIATARGGRWHPQTVAGPVEQCKETSHVHSSEAPARRRGSIDFDDGVAATRSSELIKAGRVFAEPVGADEGISPARTRAFWNGVPVGEWFVGRALGCRRSSECNADEDNGEKVLFHGEPFGLIREPRTGARQ
jgi:hypothetical protein